MAALLRYVFETGSFVTAPNVGGGNKAARLAAVVASGGDDTTSDVRGLDEQIDTARLFFPPTLSAMPLFDLTGASVPLPDTLMYRHLVLKAAYGAGRGRCR